MGVMERYQKSKKEKETSGGVMARYEMNKKYESLDVSNVDDAYISSFVSDANTFFGKFGEGKEPSYTEANTALVDLDTRYQTVAGWLYKNKSRLDRKTYADFSASLSDFKKSLAGAKDYYGQFDSEDAYQYAKKVAAIQGMSAAEIEKQLGGDAIAYSTPDGGNVTWQSLYDSKKSEEDFANRLAAAKNDANYDALVSEGNRKNGTVKWYGAVAGENKVASYRGDVGKAIDLRSSASGAVDPEVSIAMGMTEDEADLYSYILMTEGKNAADAYFDSMKDTVQRRLEAKTLEMVSDFASAHPFSASAVSVASNMVSGAEFLGDAVKAPFTGKLDTNHAANVTQAIRNSVSQKTNWEIGNFDAFDFLYNTGMSAADSVASMLTFGKGGGVALGLSAAAQGVNDAKKRGLSDGKAFLHGFFSGVFEGVFETVSIGQFGALKEAAAFGAKDIAKNVAKSMLVNASEETATELANIAYDLILNGDFSAYQTAIRSYMDSGLSESDAKKKAALDLGAQILEAGASGALMGIGFGAAGSTIGAVSNSKNIKKLYGDSSSELIGQGMESPVGTKSRKLAEKNQKKISDGKTLSGADLADMIRANEDQFRTEETSEKTTDEKTLDANGYAEILKEVKKTDASERDVEDVVSSDSEEISESSETTEQTVALPVGDSDAVNEDRNSTENTTDIENIEEDIKEVISEDAEQPSQSAMPTALPEGEPEQTVDSETALLKASEQYGAQAKAMIATYKKGQDVAAYDTAYGMAYNMGKSGVSYDYAMKSEDVKYLEDWQKEAAYHTGKDASDLAAKEQAEKNAAGANGKTGWKKGVVKGHDVSLDELRKTFNDTQNEAYKLLSFYAEATGLDIVLFRSEADVDGSYTGAQGYFNKKDNTVSIDINAGLRYGGDVKHLARYTMMRTFSHEFTHFIENWNPVRYNELRKAVFSEIEKRGFDIGELIEEKQRLNEGMTYDAASREVTAEALTDILPDADFLSLLAERHKSVFEKLREKFRDFVNRLKAHFKTISGYHTKEAAVIADTVDGTLRYSKELLSLFDSVAAEAVEHYQKTVAVDIESNDVIVETDKVETDKKEEASSLPTSETESTVTDIADKNEDLTEKSAESEQYDHFSVTDNEYYGTLEIKFDVRPSQAIRDMLRKEYRFHWNGKKGVWYGKADRKEIAASLQAVYKAYDIGVTEARTQKTIVPAMKSQAMNELEKEVRNHLLPVIDAYNKGVADEINRQTVSEIRQEEANDTTESLAEQPETEGSSETSEVIPEEKTAEEKTVDKHDELTLSDFEKSFWNASQEERDEVVDAVNANTGFTRMRPAEIYGENTSLSVEETNITKQEVTQNGENADNEAAVPQSHADRQGDSRVLDELETRDVSGDASERDSLAGAVQREREIARDDHSADAGRSEREHGEGSGKSRDLRRDDGLTQEEISQKAEELHEEVKTQIEQKSTEMPKGKNFVIGDSLSLPNGEKARYKLNVAAIRLVKKLEAEGRYATEFEQQVLSKYVGWGGLSQAFDERKEDWSHEYKELKDLLTDEEYRAAKASTLNAHFTDISLIRAMYDGLAKLGFGGGRMLEPSCGVGNFVGAMPGEMTGKVKSWTMIELDGITGLIAKYLYPNADVRIQGFETAKIPDRFMDVAIGNVPFGKIPVYDPAYPKKMTGTIHNYFFAKTLDKVRPGGIVMFITSSYTMSSKDSFVRNYMMQKADLLGAIRLPNTAFKNNAGTNVVSDILILKKRADHTLYTGEDFLETTQDYLTGEYVNAYFRNHPEMVLGTAATVNGRYGGDSVTYHPLVGKGSLEDQVREAFSHIEGKMDYPSSPSPEKTNFAVERAAKKPRQYGFVSREGKIFQERDGDLVPIDVSGKAAERMNGMIGIRDAAKNLLNFQQQGLNDDEIRKARQTLGTLYDDFVGKYGFLNTSANRAAFKEDPDSYFLLSLENWDSKKKTATKADIFTKNTVSPNRTVTSAKDISEGLIVSVNLTGGIDVPLIARLTGKTEEGTRRELIDSRLVYKNRDGMLETAESYLSGNVRAKLRDAEAMVSLDADYQKNVEALKAIVPKDVSYEEIAVQPGTPWIPDSVYSDFAAYMLGGKNSDFRQDVDVTRNPETGNFTVDLKNARLKYSANNTQRWGTNKRSFIELFDAMLNGKRVVINIKMKDGSHIMDKDATAAANEKIENITKAFSEWLWKDEPRRKELSTLYNETFNSIVTPKYNGEHLTVNGLVAGASLRPHQKDAVQRIISSGGNTLLAHKVGAGKTLEMAAAAMKLKQLGLVRKPMFAVPKSLVAQWGKEFMDFFPTARLLVAESSDFTAANRKIFMNRIANGDYDAVIVSYEQFEKLPMSADFTRTLYQEQIDGILAAIQDLKAKKGQSALSVKDLEAKRKSLETKIAKLSDSAKDEGNIDFEELGIDALFIDEAHNFKNLFYTTHMTNISGLGNRDGSKRAFDLYTKVRYLQKLNGGRGIVFATATPVMNSMSEMYIMQKYLQPDLLNQLGLTTFDAWAKQFGEVVNGVEIKPSGQGYRVKQSFSRFKNMNELQLLFRHFADVLTTVPGLSIPKMRGGKVNVVVCEPGEFQKEFMKELEKRADNVKNVDPSVDNMLKITSDGRKVSYTQRMIDPSLPYEEGCKIYRCADIVAKEYHDSTDVLGTQLIFCDMATPKGNSKKENAETDTDSDMDMESARLYDDIKARLIKGGIPEKEIAFIHEADSDAKKKKLFADMNDGVVRVLIGSTGKMGVGMNAQKRIVAIHHLDAPWRPGDVEQRDGRAFRQKNINEYVAKYTYVTEGSFDARLWDILDRKQHFITQIMNGESVGREVEDTGEVTLSAAEVKALASGNPMIMEQVQLDTDIKKLEGLYRAHVSAVREAVLRAEADRGIITRMESMIEMGNADLAAREDTYSDGKFRITIGGREYTDKKEAGTALATEIISKADKNEFAEIGRFAGFSLRAIKTDEGYRGMISGRQDYDFKIYPDNTPYMMNHVISLVKGLDDKIEGWKNRVSDVKKDLEEQTKLMQEPFAKGKELDEKRARFLEIMAILNPKTEQVLYDEDDVQEQARTDRLTDREVLAFAADRLEGEKFSDAQRDALDIFKKHLDKLGELMELRAEEGRTYKTQQFGAKPDRAEAGKTLNRMKILDEQIKRKNEELLSIEEKSVLQAVLRKARTVVEAEERKHGKEELRRWRDRRNNSAAIKKYRERILKDTDEISKWILHPDNKTVVKHVPDALKEVVIPFLNAIDFTSKRALRGGDATKADERMIKKAEKLRDALVKAKGDDRYSGYNDLPPDFSERLQGFIDTATALTKQGGDHLVINTMTSEEMKTLSGIVRILKKHIMECNRFHANAMYEHVFEAGNDTVSYLQSMKSGAGSTASNFVFWQQIRPAYAWERFGSGGKAIYDGFRRGQATLAFNTKKILDFAETAYTETEVREWEKEVVELELDGDTVRMPVSALMSLYVLAKRPQAVKHLLGGGLRVATFKNGKKKEIDTGHILSEEDLEMIADELSPRQREVADALQKFMATQGGEWGNYVSMKRFGEKQFTEDNYFPINSDGRILDANADEHPNAASLYALLNMGFTKSTNENANNRLVLYSIFDVFANHMASMAQYNAFALPVLDALKWFNYTQFDIADDGTKTKIGNIREELNRVFGTPIEDGKMSSGKKGYAETFIINIIRAFNGTEAQGTPMDTWGMNFNRRYNMAQIAYNLRVIVQQPLAITRAALLIDYASIAKGLQMTPSILKKNIEEMNTYSGIAAWKSLGFYDTNISRGLTSLIRHDANILDKIGEFGMFGAEKADEATWAAIWNACKTEIEKKQKLSPSDDAYFRAVTALFEDVIYKTQVVDSVLTKNEFLRSKGFFARAMSSFMSEPTTSASMVIDAFDKYQSDIKRGFTRSHAWQRNKKNIGRTVCVWSVNALILAAAQAVVDALRDDDDYENPLEKWWEAFTGNFIDEMLPFNKLPILADFYELAKEMLSTFGVDTYGNPPRTLIAQWWDHLVNGTKIIYDKITGTETDYTWFGGIYKLLQAVSGITGLPTGTVTREIVTAWNNTVGAMAPSLKVKTYDAGARSEIRYAYIDGYLTEKEATKALIEKGIAEDQNEAYFMIREWDAKGSYSRYDAILSAVRNLSPVRDELYELTSHGYTEKETVSKIKGEIGKWYRSGEITRSEAEKMLMKYGDTDRDTVKKTVDKWSCIVVTGIAYEDIDDQYLSGKITRQRAIRMYMLYGNMTKEDATKKVDKLKE